ncbi:nuclear transport factor 2 family protein [Halomicronema hongdechloris]|uniref:nuclear transport factor 2 family protein n=1 Tax=Halomicronema hongdechloris TaxID=1209493 RepID=UPI001CED8D7C|nr:SgcJ/EcaC family oxidoreductase [Halomicronema hongdechloris]
MYRRAFSTYGLLAIIFPTRGATQTMDPSVMMQTVIQLARRAWLQGDGQAFATLFGPTGEFIVPGQCWQGPEAILQACQTFMATHQVTAIDIRNVVIQENRAMVEWSWQEVERSSGQVSTAEDAIAIDIQGTHIQRWREYIDTDTKSP